MYRHIVLRQLRKPPHTGIETDLRWMCDSFGFVQGRDINKLAARIMLDLVEKSARVDKVSSDMIAKDLHITPARVNHHIRNIMESGILFRKKQYIFLQGGSLKSAVEEMRRDANSIFDELSRIAEEIDDAVGLENR